MKRSEEPAMDVGSKTAEDSLLVLTVGHSTRPIEEFIQMLQAHRVTCVADIRTIPRSRYNPQFNGESLAHSLRQANIRYVHMPALGGLKRPRPDSVNSGWRNASFRGFADYMQTTKFRKALAELEALARGERVAIMCAEAVPWRCHRSLVADGLLAHGIRVAHIMSSNGAREHTLTPFARIQDQQVTYPSEDTTPLSLE